MKISPLQYLKKKQKELSTKLMSDQLGITHLQAHGENPKGGNHLPSFSEQSYSIDTPWSS